MMSEPEPLYVSREEYEREEQILYELDNKLSSLQLQWETWVSKHPDRIIVSRDEYNGEMQGLQLLQKQLKDEWSRAMHYLAVYRWQRRRELRAVIRVIPPLSWSTLELYRESRRIITGIQKLIREERGRIERKLIIPPEIERLLREISQVEQSLEQERARFERKVIVELERVGDEECSGMDIWFNPAEGNYVVKHPATDQTIRVEDKLCIEITYSIATRTGHDVPLTVEITVTSYVQSMDKGTLIITEQNMDDAMRTWLEDNDWGQLLDCFKKIGVAYNGEQHVNAKKRYPWTVPDYPTVHAHVERKSKYISHREYEGEFEAE